jgi:hypothetical protein
MAGDKLTGAAILFWLPPDCTELSSDFDVHFDIDEPPRPNPEAWWEFRDAVMHAMQVELHKQTHNKLPWIKVGDRVLSPKEVSAVYAELKGQKGA